MITHFQHNLFDMLCILGVSCLRTADHRACVHEHGGRTRRFRLFRLGVLRHGTTCSPRAKPAAQPPAGQQPRPPEGEPRALDEPPGSPMRTSLAGSPRADEGAPLLNGAPKPEGAWRHRRVPSELPPEIAPPAPRADMVLTPPTVLHRRAPRTMNPKQPLKLRCRAPRGHGM